MRSLKFQFNLNFLTLDFLIFSNAKFNQKNSMTSLDKFSNYFTFSSNKLCLDSLFNNYMFS